MTATKEGDVSTACAFVKQVISERTAGSSPARIAAMVEGAALMVVANVTSDLKVMIVQSLAAPMIVTNEGAALTASVFVKRDLVARTAASKLASQTAMAKASVWMGNAFALQTLLVKTAVN